MVRFMKEDGQTIKCTAQASLHGLMVLGTTGSMLWIRKKVGEHSIGQKVNNLKVNGQTASSQEWADM